MRLLFAAAVRSTTLATTLAAALALPAGAADTAQQTGMKSCAATWKTMSAADKAKTKYTDYMGTCMKGGAKTAAAPAPAMAMSGKPMMSGSMNSMKMEAGGQAKCKDGTTVTYKKRSGTCSGHGGVATWM
jgi:hypothetical protein